MFKRYVSLYVGFLSWSLISGCNSDTAAEVNQEGQNAQVSEAVVIAKSDVAKAIEQALENSDFRLLHSKGRRIVVPGLESHELSLLKLQCGLKPMQNSGDVLKSDEQRQQQKQQYFFAQQYNQAIYEKCLENLTQAG